MIEQQRPDRDRQTAELPRHCNSRRESGTGLVQTARLSVVRAVSGSLASALLLDLLDSGDREGVSVAAVGAQPLCALRALIESSLSCTGSGPSRSSAASWRAEVRVNPPVMSAPLSPEMPLG